MSKARYPTNSGERGAALVLAIFVLTTLAFMALFLSSTASVNRRLAGDELSKAKALRYAEAGVAEALARIQAGQGPDANAVNAARKVVQILNASSGGNAGADTTLLATGQPSGQWLTYSTSTKGGKALTIEFRTDAARTVIYKYDRTLNPPVQTASGQPILRITSTGTVGAIRRSVVAEVCYSPTTTLDLRAAFCSGQDVKFSGNAVSCGYDHRDDTPDDTGDNGRTGSGGCNENSAATPPKWEYPTGAVAGIWSTGNGNGGGASNAYGSPANSNYNSAFYAGPWEVLGMSKTQFYAWAGSPSKTMPANPSGITYVDNDGTQQNASGSWSNNDGTGFLYADGDLTLHNNWRGLIYVEGDLKLNSHAWILGAVVCKGDKSIKFNGGATVLYSKAAIKKYIPVGSGGSSSFTTIAWREL